MRREIFPSYHRIKECEAIGGCHSRGQALRVSVGAQGHMPVGIMTSKAKISDQTPPIGVRLLSLQQESSKMKILCVWVPELQGVWLQAASAAGRLCSWLRLKWTDSFAGLGT